MSPLASLANHQIRLAARPVGLPNASNWSHSTEPVAESGEGGIVVKTLAISLDPAMRGWMNDGKSYIPPVAIGEVMRAGGVGTVMASNNADYPVGQAVSVGTGVQEYLTLEAADFKRAGLVKIDLGVGSLTQWLNVLGMPGMTGYFGLMDVGMPQPGETVVVSGAAGAVGQTVGQMAKIKGCRVVGIAGGADKCAYVQNELGVAACVDYKGGKLAADLKAACPNGIDVYFENVGGEILDTVLLQMNPFGRIPVCGLISAYNATSMPDGPKNLRVVLTQRLTMRGLIVFDWANRIGEAITQLGNWAGEGKLKIREDVRTGGIDAFPATLNLLYTGGNNGKLVLKV